MTKTMFETKPKGIAKMSIPTKGNATAATRLQEAIEMIASGGGVDVDAVKSIIAEDTADIRSRLDSIANRAADKCEFKINDVTVLLDEPKHKLLESVVKIASAKNRKGYRPNILLVGESGCGKTHLAGQLAKVLGLPFGFISLTAGISEAHLAGRYLPIGKSGSFEYVISLFAGFYKNGGVFLLDEMDAADPNVLLIINAALANGSMRLPDGSELKRSTDFVCIGAANTYGNGADRKYSGRNQQDCAVMDRFVASRFQMTYDEDLERSYSDGALCEWSHSIRQRIVDNKLRRVMSTRFIFEASDMIAAGAYTIKDAKRSYLLDWSDNELNTIGEKRPK